MLKFWPSWLAAKPSASFILLDRDDATSFVVCASRDLFAQPCGPKLQHLDSLVLVFLFGISWFLLGFQDLLFGFERAAVLMTSKPCFRFFSSKGFAMKLCTPNLTAWSTISLIA